MIKKKNSEAERLFGSTRAELLGQSIEMLVPERLRKAHSGHRARFFAAPGPRQMSALQDLYGLAKDGREIPLEIGLNPIRIAFFFSSRRRHTRLTCDWSSDVCSSD